MKKKIAIFVLSISLLFQPGCLWVALGALCGAVAADAANNAQDRRQVEKQRLEEQQHQRRLEEIRAAREE